MSEDQTLTCVDCKQSFTWSASEQEFFHEKGFTDTPKRCKSCRQAKKEQRGVSKASGRSSDEGRGYR